MSGRATAPRGGKDLSESLKLHFVCSRNQIRSLTAEHLFDGRRDVRARSAGTSDQARVRVTAGQIGWADLIFVMERKHLDLLRRRFGAAPENKQVINLDVPDDYRYGDDALIELLSTRGSYYVNPSKVVVAL